MTAMDDVCTRAFTCALGAVKGGFWGTAAAMIEIALEMLPPGSDSTEIASRFLELNDAACSGDHVSREILVWKVENALAELCT